MKYSKEQLKKILKIQTIILIVIFIITVFGMNSFATNETETSSYTNEQNDLNILSDAVILIDNATGRVLYSKNSNQKMYPASTTKIMTTILAIEKGNLTDTTTASNAAISVIPAGYSSAYLSEGEEMTIEQLLEVLLIHSANDAANVLAEYISGSIEEFVNLMNEKAQELGCENTHFVNTNGIHDSNHYTTAYDLSLIFKYCLQNQTFREIISMPSCTIPATNKSGIREYTNTNSLIDSTSDYYYENCLGGKTGYTSQAKNCLVSVCKKDNLELISVILGATQTEDGKSARYTDAINLYNYGYSAYSISTIAQKSDIIYTIDVSNGTLKTKSLDLLLANDITALVNTSSSNNISSKISIEENLSAPIAANSVIGTVTYSVNGITYTENLIAAHDVEKSNIMIIILIIMILTLLTIIFYIYIHNKKKN